MHLNPALIVFVKNPVAGKVKTRIAKDTGDDKALEIYLQLIDITRYICDKCEVATKYLFYSDYVPDVDQWDEKIYHKLIQQGNHLGDRMQHAFASVLRNHNSAVIIGSDCPYLTAGHLEKAFDHLQTCDAIFGPSRDGGYYLLGMNQLLTSLFEDMPWSKPELLKQSINTLIKNQNTFFLLDELEDIDTLADWQKYICHGNE